VADLRGLDLVFCMLPHGASQDFVPGMIDDVSHVIDLGADFRLPPDVYTRWYGETHRAPEIVGRFAYGMVELYPRRPCYTRARRGARFAIPPR